MSIRRRRLGKHRFRHPSREKKDRPDKQIDQEKLQHIKSRRRKGKLGRSGRKRGKGEHTHETVGLKETSVPHRLKPQKTLSSAFRLFDYQAEKRSDTLTTCSRYMELFKHARPPVIENLVDGTTIYAVGDIHGDLQLLQVILVDLLKVVSVTVRIASDRGEVELPITNIRHITDNLSGDNEKVYTVTHEGVKYPVTPDNTYYHWCGRQKYLCCFLWGPSGP